MIDHTLDETGTVVRRELLELSTNSAGQKYFRVFAGTTVIYYRADRRENHWALSKVIAGQYQAHSLEASSTNYLFFIRQRYENLGEKFSLSAISK